MELNYDLKSWASETDLGRRIFNYNFRMLGRELPGWQMLKVVPMHQDRALSEITWLWQNKQQPDRELVRVNVVETADWRAAQKHLLRMLSHCMKPDLPRGTGRLTTLGDIEFVARAPESDLAAAIQFVRGNSVVSVNSVGSMTIDVSDIAVRVDRLLSEPPNTIPVLRKLARRQPSKAVIAKRKGAMSLIRDLGKFGDKWLKVITPDGEVRRKGKSLSYLAPQPGKKSVQIFSILTSGGSTQRK